MRGVDYQKWVIFKELSLWMDSVKRSGPETMAVDEWLLETASRPVLRVYDWAGDWGSLGYFGKLEAARASLPEVCWVRRWTGGGTVDHRADWTYTLVAPQNEPLVRWRGAESYRRIHEALVATLVDEGRMARLSTGTEETGAALCFENPVNHDVLDAAGAKLAGAGQRRSRQGLLHQGSVAGSCCTALSSKTRATDFAGRLALEWQLTNFQPEPADLARRAASRYGRAGWTERR